MRVNEELRARVLQQVNQKFDLDHKSEQLNRLPKSNLMKFLFDYLNNPENYLKLQP